MAATDFAIRLHGDVGTTARTRAPRTAALALGAACLGLGATGAVADTPPERTEVQFKVLDYSETQPGADRVAVRAATTSVVTPLGERASLAASYTVDSISGASPLYHTQRLTKLKDFRRGYSLAGTGYHQDGSVTASASVSSESDYFSRAFGLLSAWNSSDRNTTLTVGVGDSSDLIRPVYGGFEDRKRVRDALLGLTRVLTPQDVVQLNLSHTWGQGYFTDPYKLLDERPRTRHISRMLLRWNHHFAGTEQTLRMSWRYSQDSWSLRAHTATVEWVHGLGSGWTLTPMLRGYTQTAANFYVPVDPAVAPAPPFPPDGQSHYSADQRLAAFGAYTAGLRVDKAFNRDWSIDFKIERYEQRSGWALSGRPDPGLAAFRALWLQAGITHRF